MCSRKVADLTEFWNGQKYVKLLDPNLLACREHIGLLQQLVDSRAYVDFTQGLDIRLTTPENIQLLNRMRIKRLHFAWDNPKEDLVPYFERFTELYKRKDSSRKIVYVLTNFGSTMEENLYRVYTLCELGYGLYIMIYDKPNAPREVQSWVNNKIIFGCCPKFEDYRF